MRTVASLVTALAASTGCISLGSSPPPNTYILSPTVPADPVATDLKGAGGVLGVASPRVPDYLERPQIVTLRSPNQVELDEFSRWAELPSAAVKRVLAQDLGALLPGWQVVEQPWDPAAPVTVRLLVDVQEMGWNPEGEARLRASWALVSGTGVPARVRGEANVGRRAASARPDDGVAALSELLGDLAREVAGAVRRLPLQAP